MERSKRILDNVDLDKDKGKGKGPMLFIAAMVIAGLLFYFFAIKPSQNDSATPVQQGTEQTAPASTPASQ